MSATVVSFDVLDRLIGVDVSALRSRRPVTRDEAQRAHDALFRPVSDGEFSRAERALIAAFATRLTADDAAAATYAGRALRIDPDLAPLVLAEAVAAATTGPFGHFREGGLVASSTDGDRYEPDAGVVAQLGARLSAALAHVHLLTYRPREADDTSLARLLVAGWSEGACVTLSQLVSFLAFQQRVAAGLRVLAGEELA